MRPIDEYKKTTNRRVYNRARKWYLESTGKIRCSWCKYHKGENDTCTMYSYNEIVDYRRPSKSYIRNRVPNWKLCTKNKKQWQSKKLIENGSFTRYNSYNKTEQTYHWYTWR